MALYDDKFINDLFEAREAKLIKVIAADEQGRVALDIVIGKDYIDKVDTLVSYIKNKMKHLDVTKIERAHESPYTNRYTIIIHPFDKGPEDVGTVIEFRTAKDLLGYLNRIVK